MTELGRIVAARVTLSPHEWTWTDEEQIEMARTIISLERDRAELVGIVERLLSSTGFHREVLALAAQALLARLRQEAGCTT